MKPGNIVLVGVGVGVLVDVEVGVLVGVDVLVDACSVVKSQVSPVVEAAWLSVATTYQ